MTLQEIYKSYTYSLNISLFVMTLITISFAALVVANNKEAMAVFFYKPLLYAGFAAIAAFVAIPFMTILGRYLQKIIQRRRS